MRVETGCLIVGGIIVALEIALLLITVRWCMEKGDWP